MLLENAIAEFVADLQLGGRAAGTIEKHKLELARLGRWLELEALDWQQLERRDMQRFARLRAELGHSARANMMCSLRTFCAWSVEQGYMAISPAAGFKTPTRPQPLPRALTIEQIQRLLSYLRSCKGRRARRDEVLIITALYSGLRCCELAGLRWSSVDLDGAVVNIHLSKMNKGRSVPMHPALVQALTEWRELQQLDACAPVFSLTGEQFKSTRVGKIAYGLAAATGIRFSAHMLRHTFATWTLRKSKNLYAVSKSLGHAQVRQTEIYVSVEVEDLRNAVDQLPSVGEW